MTACAGTQLVLGASFIFLPEEISKIIFNDASTQPLIILQILGALYFSYGVLNWLAKGSIIGGIYN